MHVSCELYRESGNVAHYVVRPVLDNSEQLLQGERKMDISADLPESEGMSRTLFSRATHKNYINLMVATI
jgi:hypothetical protein